ncbi:MAG: cell division protein FtsA [Chloroflexota bacterium]
MNDLVVGIDVGTNKICTIVGEVRQDDIFVVGVGIEPSRGMKKGVVNDITSLTAAVSASVHKAEKSSGYDIGRAFVSVAGNHIASMNSRGATGISGTRGVTMEDIDRAMEAARAIAIPHNREVLHVVPRSYSLDGQDRVRSPIGMHGFRLEVEAHIITAATTSVANLEQGVEAAGVYVDRFILNPLASGDTILTADEREMGIVVIDIGGGTTDLAIFIEGTVWHTAVIPLGGDHVTNDIASIFHLPFHDAEAVKLKYGHAVPRAVDETETFLIQPFGEGYPDPIKRVDLAEVIEARAEEMFEHVHQEIKRSGYDGLLRAGAVITGGASQLSGMRDVAAKEFGFPVRTGKPEKLTGMADALKHPSYSTSVGLLRLGLQMDTAAPAGGANGGGGIGALLGNLFKRLLPDSER